MPLQYILSGGQLKFDKLVFTRELILADSPLKRLLLIQESANRRKPKVTKTEKEVIVDFNSADIILDEGFYDLFKKLKLKHKGKIRGSVVISITALTSYHVVLDLNSEDDKVIYE